MYRRREWEGMTRGPQPHLAIREAQEIAAWQGVVLDTAGVRTSSINFPIRFPAVCKEKCPGGDLNKHKQCYQYVH